MRSGLTIGTSGAFGAIGAEARRAEQLGFDLLASGEHVFFHGPTSNAFRPGPSVPAARDLRPCLAAKPPRHAHSDRVPCLPHAEGSWT